MQVIRSLALAAFFGACLWPAIPTAHAQVSIGISINIEPPPLPVYEQPPIPAPGYLWVPGYWAWNEEIDDYYWVPGTWILPPEPALLWTPGYWAWNGGAYVFYDGYWGPEIGFYGGVNYGFGYTGFGYEGGYWRNGAFFYNTSVNNISNTTITNVYNKTVVVNNTSNVSYNGGAGGTTAKPTVQQLAIAKERHLPPTQEQTRHVQTAAKDPALSLTQSQGHPTVAATARPAQFKGPGVVAARPGTPVLPAKPGTPSKAATPFKRLNAFQAGRAFTCIARVCPPPGREACCDRSCNRWYGSHVCCHRPCKDGARRGRQKAPVDDACIARVCSAVGRQACCDGSRVCCHRRCKDGARRG